MKTILIGRFPLSFAVMVGFLVFEMRASNAASPLKPNPIKAKHIIVTRKISKEQREADSLQLHDLEIQERASSLSDTDGVRAMTDLPEKDKKAIQAIFMRQNPLQFPDSSISPDMGAKP